MPGSGPTHPDADTSWFLWQIQSPPGAYTSSSAASSLAPLPPPVPRRLRQRCVCTSRLARPSSRISRVALFVCEIQQLSQLETSKRRRKLHVSSIADGYLQNARSAASGARSERGEGRSPAAARWVVLGQGGGCGECVRSDV